MAKPIRGGTALVTGAGKRLGRAIAEHLGAHGFAVALHCNRSRRDAEEVMATLVSKGGRASIVEADLIDPSAVETLLPAASAALGPVTLLVNSAAIFIEDRIEDFDSDLFDRHFAVNLRAPLQLARAFAAALPAASEGAIVNLIDQRVLHPDPRFLSYGLSKSALLTATKTLAQALAPRIRVNGVGPGPTFVNDQEGAAGFRKEICETLLQRRVDPQDIAEAVLFLATARSVTGQMIAVDSGQHLAWRL